MKCSHRVATVVVTVTSTLAPVAPTPVYTLPSIAPSSAGSYPVLNSSSIASSESSSFSSLPSLEPSAPSVISSASSSVASSTTSASSTSSALGATASGNADGKQVYAHFMVSGIDSRTDHAQQDIDSAQAMGFDGFALNIKSPDADWAIECIDQLFAAAEGTGFKLFFSLDMNGNTDNEQFTSLFDHFDDEAYLKVDEKPFVSTFWGGNLGQQAWSGMKDYWNLHLVPSFDDLSGYYDDPAGFFESWDGIVDGAFNWESAWPGGHGNPANVSAESDIEFQEAAAAADLDFMMAISPLQYKHCCGGNYYRVGEGNLPERMTQILDVKPQMVQYMTWNDGGESHYIGNLWEEAFASNPEIVAYANNEEFPHFAWQPLFSSFIQAYKNGVDASQMTPPGDAPVGAMWYRPVLKSCSSDSPDNASAAIDAVNFGFVLPGSLEGATIRVTSGGNVISETTAVAGLNYGTVDGMTTGAQKVEIVQNGSVVATAAGTKDVQAEMDFCNFNYYVIGLESA